MIDTFSVLLGLFIGIFSGSAIGAMIMLFFLLFARVNFGEHTEDLSTDEDIEEGGHNSY